MTPNNEIENSIEKNSSISITIHEENVSLLAASIQEALPKKGAHICSIYRVSDKLRSGKEEIYNPRFVSIGPYHRMKKNFMVTENHKRWYFHNLIERFPQASLPNILNIMKDLEAEARGCYAEETNIGSDEFVTMMLVDGCFMLELFYKYRETIAKLETMQNREKVLSNRRRSTPVEDEEVNMGGEASNGDLIFSSWTVIRRIRVDFVLLENQLPLVVLRSLLFELTKDPESLCTLNKLIMDFLDDIIPTNLIRNDDTVEGKHLLDLVRCAITPLQQKEYGKSYPHYNTARYSAVELHEFGIIFKVNVGATSLMDIDFDMETGVLKIPYFFHGRCLSMLIPNLIALEKAHPPYTKEITSYALFLVALVKTKADVRLLNDGGITNKVTRNEEDIASEINRICQGVETKMFYYEDLCDNIHLYCKIGWPRRIKRFFHRWKVTLHRDYISVPWAILSPIAAIILLVLTLMQTVYSTPSYSHRI